MTDQINEQWKNAPELLNQRQSAKLLGVTPPTVASRIKQGKLAFTIVGKRKMIAKTDLMKMAGIIPETNPMKFIEFRERVGDIDTSTDQGRRLMKIQYFICPDCNGELTERISDDENHPIAIGCVCGFSILTDLQPGQAEAILECRRDTFSNDFLYLAAHQVGYEIHMKFDPLEFMMDHGLTISDVSDEFDVEVSSVVYEVRIFFEDYEDYEDEDDDPPPNWLKVWFTEMEPYSLV